jgi:hypothetical protein
MRSSTSAENAPKVAREVRHDLCDHQFRLFKHEPWSAPTKSPAQGPGRAFSVLPENACLYASPVTSSTTHKLHFYRRAFLILPNWISSHSRRILRREPFTNSDPYCLMKRTELTIDLGPTDSTLYPASIQALACARRETSDWFDHHSLCLRAEAGREAPIMASI